MLPARRQLRARAAAGNYESRAGAYADVSVSDAVGVNTNELCRAHSVTPLQERVDVPGWRPALPAQIELYDTVLHAGLSRCSVISGGQLRRASTIETPDPTEVYPARSR